MNNQVTDIQKYQLADLSNGQFGEVFSNLEDTQAAYQEAVSDGFFAEKECERVENGHEPRSDEEIMRQTLAFFRIVDAETGEEI